MHQNRLVEIGHVTSRSSKVCECQDNQFEDNSQRFLHFLLQSTIYFLKSCLKKPVHCYGAFNTVGVTIKKSAHFHYCLKGTPKVLGKMNFYSETSHPRTPVKTYSCSKTT